MEKAKVYFTKEINSNGLIRIYDKLNVELKEKTAVKISTGEPGGHNFLQPSLIKGLVNKIKGTIVECSTAYDGGRMNPQKHWQTIKDHGFFDIAPCDIMDEYGYMELDIQGGFHLKKNLVGEHLKNYSSILVLSHFKGHAMAGLGGALKNISIGIASKEGKTNIHSAGVTSDVDKLFDTFAKQDDFLESMADASKAVIDYVGAQNMVYINVANRLSVDCDCDSHPAEPEMADIGIFASTDPVAVDKACYDAVMNSSDSGKLALIERMTSRNGIRTIEASFELGLGNMDYELISID